MCIRDRHIKNGHLIDPANGIDGLQDLFIADGKVLAVGSAPAGFTADTTFDAAGLVVSPGLVDLSARLREPGYEYKATLESELQAALQGGVTSLVCPPDTDPVLDEPGLVEMLKYRAKTQNKAHVHPLGALTMGLKGKSLTEMAELTEAGCIGFAQAEEPIEDTTVLLRAMQYANTFGYTVWLRPQDPHIGRGGIAHSGPLASRLGLSGVPVMSETIALHTIFELMRASRARVHLCRISSAAGLELIRAAKAEGLPVTCDVGVHHVHLTDADIGFFDPNARVTPPFRSQRDRDAIRARLRLRQRIVVGPLQGQRQQQFQARGAGRGFTERQQFFIVVDRGVVRAHGVDRAVEQAGADRIAVALAAERRRDARVRIEETDVGVRQVHMVHAHVAGDGQAFGLGGADQLQARRRRDAAQVHARAAGAHQFENSVQLSLIHI